MARRWRRLYTRSSSPAGGPITAIEPEVDTAGRRATIRNISIALGVGLFVAVGWGLNQVLIWFAHRDIVVFAIPKQEWTTRKGQNWPVGGVFSLGNRPDADQDYWNLRDDEGFSAIVRPPGHVPSSIRTLPPPLQQSIMLPSRADGGYHLLVGDSNVHINPGWFFFRISRPYWGDALGVPNTGTDLEAFAVKEWLAAMDGELSAHPTTQLTVTLCVTPHNDLEDLRDKPDPPSPRLRFSPDPERKSPAAVSRVSLRSAGKFVTDMLGWDWKTKAFYRQVIGAGLFGNQKLFTPSVHQAEVRRLLYYVDDVAQTLEEYASSGRPVALEIVPLYSPYDWPSRRFSYTWGSLLGSYATGQFRDPTSPPPSVRIKVVDVRDMVHAWFPADSDYATLFYRAEQHYSTRGKARLALAWGISAGYQTPPSSASELAAREQSLVAEYQGIAREVRSLAERRHPASQ
jgi:hypothetical protein